MTEPLKESGASDCNRLGPDQQRRVLEFARTLAAPSIPGVSGEVTARFAGAIPEDDLAIISRAIEKGCERVDPGEW